MNEQKRYNIDCMMFGVELAVMLMLHRLGIEKMSQEVIEMAETYIDGNAMDEFRASLGESCERKTSNIERNTKRNRDVG